jgi:YidC/Oxa1 family membrane protein insertase
MTITEDVVEGWGPLLLVIYVASQLSSSYLMSATMQKAQRILLMALPIVFIPFILNFPAGLMIYWLTTNLWTTGQGIVTRKLIPRPQQTEQKRSSRTPPKEKEEPAAEETPAPARSGAKKAAGADGEKKVVAGPPRRVKRKRGGQRR